MMALAANGTASVALSALLRPWLSLEPGLDRPVTDICLDSRQAGAGSLFLALAGGRHHGLDFLQQVIDRGAVAVAWDEADPALVGEARRHCDRAGVAGIQLDGLREHAGEIAGAFFGEPSRAMSVIGVTGTDGKTSVTQFIAQALTAGGTSSGVLGTLGYGLHGHLATGTHTTPDAVSVQRLLADLKRRGAAAVAMEVSSHALDQHRVSGVAFACAVLTNLSRDHLDYHGSEAAYAQAKARLFTECQPAAAVLNADDAFGRQLLARLPAAMRPLTYSLDPKGEADLCAESVDQNAGGLVIDARVLGERLRLTVPLLGRFNAANVLATAGALLALGYRPADLGAALEALQPVPGRMERFGGGDRPAVIIDYAHTPAALQAALEAMGNHFGGELWCVFGCGGDRDRGKRALMGEVAGRLADHVVITDDNPRTEDPDRIIEEIRHGAGSQAIIQRDRAAAIALALERARPGDAVLVAGKGHEDYQIIGEQRLAFSDRRTVETLLGGRD